MTKEKSDLRDLLYFDVDRAASLWSQMHDGLLETTNSKAERAHSASGGVKGGLLGVATGQTEYGVNQTNYTVENKRIHHDLLSRLISDLESRDLLYRPPDQVEAWRANHGARPYVYCSGFAALDDFAKLQRFSQQFAWMIDFINVCTAGSMDLNENQKTLVERLELAHEAEQAAVSAENVLKKKKDTRSARAAMAASIEGLISGSSDLLLNNIAKWIEEFSADRLRVRVHIDCKEPFHVVGTLRRDACVDQSPDHMLAAYGMRPNVPLAMLGLVSSVPRPDFSHPIQKQEVVEDSGDSEVVFQAALDGVFEGFHSMSMFMSEAHYPNVVVQPIAVFRQF